MSRTNPQAPSSATQAKSIGATLMEALPVPILLIDGNRRIIAINAATAGLVDDAAVGRDVAVGLRHPDLLEAVDRVHAGSTRENGEITVGVPIFRAFEFGVVGLKEEESTDFARSLVILHDVTEIKQVNQMRADFVANVSHELRSPLTSMIGFIETLQGVAAADEPARRRFLAYMSNEAQRMKRLIDDLLSLSRVESREHQTPRDRLNLGVLLGQTVEILSRRSQDQGKAIALYLEDGLPEIEGDADELTEVMGNLIDNALKYGHKDRPVRVSARALVHVPDLGGPCVCVDVENEGPGIAPEHLPRLTERFYRVDQGRSREVGGTGLGLAIVKHIVNRHQGRLRIRSIESETTNFSVFFPLRSGKSESS